MGEGKIASSYFNILLEAIALLQRGLNTFLYSSRESGSFIVALVRTVHCIVYMFMFFLPLILRCMLSIVV